MDEVLERGIIRCFPDYGCLREIIRLEILKSNQCEEQSKVDTLVFMAIKSRMHGVLMTDETDVYSQYIYKIIFKEPIDDHWADFCETSDEKPIESNENDIVRDVQNARSLRLNSPTRILTSIVKNLRNLFQCVSKPAIPEKKPTRRDYFHQIRSDGAMMYSILNQRLPRFYNIRMDIILNQNNLQICINEDFIVAEIPHSEYDTYWAEQFTKMAMSKYIYMIVLQMNGEWIFDDEGEPFFIEAMIIDPLPRVIPQERWRDYISETRPVYTKIYDLVVIETNYKVVFRRRNHYSYFLDRDEYMYWGHLPED